MLKSIIVILLFVVLAACGGSPRFEKPNKDLPVLIEIIQLDSGEHHLRVRLTYRQTKTREASLMSCSMILDDNPVFSLTPTNIPELTAYAREVLQLNLPSNTKIPSQSQMKYTLTCTLTSPKSRDERIVNNGTLYRLSNQTPAIYR